MTFAHCKTLIFDSFVVFRRDFSLQGITKLPKIKLKKMQERKAPSEISLKETLLNYVPGKETIQAIIAGNHFVIYYNIIRFVEERGKCEACKKENSENEILSNLLSSVYDLKIIEVQFNYKSYYCHDVQKAPSFVKDIFSKVENALIKKAKIKKILCRKCGQHFEATPDDQIVIWDKEKSNSIFYEKIRNKIIREW